MWLWIGLGVVYFILLFTLGLTTVRKGHWVLFILGIFRHVLGDRSDDEPDRSRHLTAAPVGSSQVP